MTRARIVYQDWIVQLGHDPDIFPDEAGVRGDFSVETENIAQEEPRADAHIMEIEQAVARAMQLLTSDEQEFISRFHFMGESYQEIAEKSGRIVHKLEALHKRALRKLKQALTDFVGKRYPHVADRVTSPFAQCAICASECREEINQLINQKPASETWRPIIRTLREQYGIAVRSPQMLIGHQRYHGL